MLHIFGFLSGDSDIQDAGLVCKRWAEASQHRKFIKNRVIHFAQVSLQDELLPILRFIQSNRLFVNITFEQAEFGRCDKFWDIFGSRIEEISLLHCDISEKSLVYLLSNVPGLKSLQIDGCRELLMAGRLFETEQDQILLREALRNVTALSMPNNRYLSDALFSRIVIVMGNLEKLDLSGCHISFHKGLYKRFYPKAFGIDASESILTFLHISKFIAIAAAHLKHLNFSSTLIDGTALETLASTENLSLNSITLRQCDQLTNPGIVKLIQSQVALQHLDLSFSVRITDHCVAEICQVLPNLKTLKLRRCRALTDYSVVEMAKLEQLEVLDISECEAITGKGLAEGIAAKPRPKLKELYISALNICEKSIIKVSESCPYLLVLDLSFCLNAVSDVCIQMIFKNLVWIRQLHLDTCERLSDAGMTGAEMLEKLEKFRLKQAECR